MNKNFNQDIGIRTKVSPQKTLFDQRHSRFGMKIGLVETLCSQYGIKHFEKNNEHFYFASKKQMQLFVERLHFAGIEFSEI